MALPDHVRSQVEVPGPLGVHWEDRERYHGEGHVEGGQGDRDTVLYRPGCPVSKALRQEKDAAHHPVN